VNFFGFRPILGKTDAKPVTKKRVKREIYCFARQGHIHGVGALHCAARSTTASSSGMQVTRDNTTLFSYFGIELPERVPPSLSERVLLYFACRPRLGNASLILLSLSKSSRYATTQLLLPLGKPQRRFPVRFVPRNRRVYLDYGVYDTFRNLPEVAKTALKLEAKGFNLVGQLVQLSEEQVRAFSFIDERTLKRMKDHLAKVAFCFGMEISFWNRSRQLFASQ
jgi:hypothetical protein